MQKLKAVYHTLVSSAEFQGVSSWVSQGQPARPYHVVALPRGDLHQAREALVAGACIPPLFGSTLAHFVGYDGCMIFPQSIRQGDTGGNQNGLGCAEKDECEPLPGRCGSCGAPGQQRTPGAAPQGRSSNPWFGQMTVLPTSVGSGDHMADLIIEMRRVCTVYRYAMRTQSGEHQQSPTAPSAPPWPPVPPPSQPRCRGLHSITFQLNLSRV